jgi:adenylate cyclase, class 2
VPVEAELKAHVRNPDHVRNALTALSPEQVSVYRDAYLDLPDHSLNNAGRELRVRLIEQADSTRCVLTYKDAAVHASGSKPEHETEVADADTVLAILTALGYIRLIAFTKYCRNYRFTRDGLNLLATLVHVPELDDAFLEIEAVVARTQDVDSALTVIRRVLADLGIAEIDLTAELYTDAVRERRQVGR